MQAKCNIEPTLLSVFRQTQQLPDCYVKDTQLLPPPPSAPQTYTLRQPIRFEGTRQKQTDTKKSTQAGTEGQSPGGRNTPYL